MISEKEWQKRCNIDPETYECKSGTKYYKCKNMKETYSDYDHETYRCNECGYSYKLYYEDMA